MVRQRAEEQTNFELEMRGQENELKNHLKGLNQRQLQEFKDKTEREKEQDRRAGRLMAD